MTQKQRILITGAQDYLFKLLIQGNYFIGCCYKEKLSKRRGWHSAIMMRCLSSLTQKKKNFMLKTGSARCIKLSKKTQFFLVHFFLKITNGIVYLLYCSFVTNNNAFLMRRSRLSLLQVLLFCVKDRQKAGTKDVNMLCKFTLRFWKAKRTNKWSSHGQPGYNFWLFNQVFGYLKHTKFWC